MVGSFLCIKSFLTNPIDPYTLIAFKANIEKARFKYKAKTHSYCFKDTRSLTNRVTNDKRKALLVRYLIATISRTDRCRNSFLDHPPTRRPSSSRSFETSNAAAAPGTRRRELEQAGTTAWPMLSIVGRRSPTSIVVAIDAGATT